MTKKEYEALKLKDAQETLKRIYEKYPTGGPMHIVLDDRCFETNYIVWALVYAVKGGCDEEDEGMFTRIATDLLELPHEKREKIWETQQQ